MVIPRWFATKHGHELQNGAVLKDPAGNQIQVDVHAYRNTMWFGQAISVLRNVYHVQETGLVKFSYFGHGNFNIRVFHKDEKEVSYPPSLNHNQMLFQNPANGRHSNMPEFYVDYDHVFFWNEIIISGKHGGLMWDRVLSEEEIRGTSNVVSFFHYLIVYLFCFLK